MPPDVRGGGASEGAMAVPPARVKAVLRVMFMAIRSKLRKKRIRLGAVGIGRWAGGLFRVDFRRLLAFFLR